MAVTLFVSPTLKGMAVRLRALLLALALLVLGPFVSPAPRPAGAATVAAVLSEATATPFVPEAPLGKGLHLLPGTHTHDYGNLQPFNLGNGKVLRFPKSVDLSRYDPPVGDQSYIGSCTAWASTYTLVGWYLKKEHLWNTYGPMAPMYTYTRINGGADNGSYGAWALAADMDGMLPMNLYPSGSYDWAYQPTGTQEALAQRYNVTGAYVLYQQGMDDPEDGGPAPTKAQQMDAARYLIELGLAEGKPEQVELSVYDNMDNATAKGAWVGPVSGALDGGHEVVAVGYDSQGLWIENQWGTDWGLNGYAELSWSYVLSAVSATFLINGVAVNKNAPHLPPVTVNPRLALSMVNDGTPVADQSALRANEEMVLSGTGYRPGETVKLYRDGSYIGYTTVLPGGVFSLEQYDHPDVAGSGMHLYHWTKGYHTIAALGNQGDYAYATFTAA